ncbi:MAG: T9SS type A sorting domain-containing protein [Bacteroidetes bacterium]|nr:T9SS type A sorting domain-containing protein [Bacteroidota bacterium]
MKRFLFLSFWVVLFSISGLPQITITSDDMLEVGDTIRSSNTLTTGTVDFTLTGEDYTWDFSTLSVLYQQVDTFVSVWSTPLVYQLIFFYPIVATVAQKQANFDLIPGLQVTDVYNYYKGSNSAFWEAGYAFTVNGIPLPLKYDDPDVYYNFPVEYGDVDSSSSAYSIGVPGFGFYSTSRHRKNTVDGWGTLTTPFGTFETLRIKSDLQINDSLYIDTLNIGFPINRTLTEYKWMANGFGEPLLQVTQEGLVTTVKYIDSLRILTHIQSDEYKTGFLELYPNPCDDLFYVNTAGFKQGPFKIEIYSVTGQILLQRDYHHVPAGNPVISINISKLEQSNGIYLVVLRNENALYFQRLIVK